MSLTNPKKVVTEERLAEFYQEILPYLGGIEVDNVLSSSSENPVQNKIIYSALQNSGGDITPTPAASITDTTLKTAINGAGSSEDKIASAYAMKKWSNALTKRYIVDGSDVSAPIGSTGIGTWFEGDPSSIVPSTDEDDWFEISDLIGIESSNEIDLAFGFDPSSGEAVSLGGYIIDTTTGKICIKFGNTLTNPTSAKINIDITYLRNEVN